LAREHSRLTIMITKMRKIDSSEKWGEGYLQGEELEKGRKWGKKEGK